jgi:hypothetical protein
MTADQAASVTDRLLRITQLTNFQTRDFEASLAQAIRRVGSESRAQQAILGAGVQIFDERSGHMRLIVDIMVDFADVTRAMSEEERKRRVATAFGARSLLAFNAILNASFTTMRDGREVTLRGAQAIEALRQEMGNAGGTAQSFREQLLDTFEGQRRCCRGRCRPSRSCSAVRSAGRARPGLDEVHVQVSTTSLMRSEGLPSRHSHGVQRARASRRKKASARPTAATSNRGEPSIAAIRRAACASITMLSPSEAHSENSRRAPRGAARGPRRDAAWKIANVR